MADSDEGHQGTVDTAFILKQLEDECDELLRIRADIADMQTRNFADVKWSNSEKSAFTDFHVRRIQSGPETLKYRCTALNWPCGERAHFEIHVGGTRVDACTMHVGSAIMRLTDARVVDGQAAGS